MTNWNFKNGIPIYLQIMEKIKTMIASGEMEAGSQVPPVREIALQAGVNPNTMQRALTQLEQEGLLYTQRTVGRFVTEDESVMKRLRRDLSEGYIRELFTNLEKLGMSRGEILEAVEGWTSEREKIGTGDKEEK